MKAVKDKDSNLYGYLSDMDAKRLISQDPKRFCYVPKSAYKKLEREEKHNNQPHKLIQQIKRKHMAQEKEINKLIEKVALLQAENEKLNQEQNEFMEEVMKEIDKIESTNSFWKYFKYVSLVVQMITTIKDFAEKRKGTN